MNLFFCCYAATQLALQLQQERTQVVCSNRVARKRPARRHFHNGPSTVVKLKDQLFYLFFVVFCRRVASPKVEALLCAPKGGFWPDDFSKKNSPGFHIFFK